MPYGYDVVTRVLDAATSLGWVQVTLGFDGGDTGMGEVTRVQATGELLEHFHVLGVRWQAVSSPPPEDLIIIAMEAKGKGRKLADRDGDVRVGPMQDNLHRINEFLLSKCIHLNCSDDVLLDPEDGVVSQGDIKPTKGRYNPKDRPRALNFQQVVMRRIFAHGSFDKGGRFYHGWWQHIRSEYRERILIMDYLTVECDYSGIALVCLYAREHQSMEDGDPYDIGLEYTSSSDPRRKIVKQYLNAIINDATRKYRIKSASLRELGLTANELRRRINRRHRKIQHLVNTGVGLEMQYIDSKIAEQVMLRFVEIDEVCLPVHDSFIVRRGMQKKLLEVMQSEFERETGTTIEIKSAVADDWAGLGTLSDSVQPSAGERGSSAAMAMAAAHLGSYSICLGYLDSWREQCMSEQERRFEDRAIDEYLEARKDAGGP
jgi:hypothetical protein